MDDNCGEWVECMGVASGSGWNLWVWLAGGCGCGCGCKEIYRFPHVTYLLFFAAASLLFVNYF